MKMARNLLMLVTVAATIATASAQIGFLFEPSSQSASVGANALFLGTAYGPSPIGYQWRKNGALMIGQTQDFLYLSGLQLTDSADYDVVATGASGSITSQIATLVVEGTFTKVMADPLVLEGGNSTGSGWADFDNDGDLDVLVTHAGTDFNSLFRNDNGHFTKLNSPPVTTDLNTALGAAWADYDNDGWIDLLVVNSGQSSGSSIFLYHNNGNGMFTRTNTALASPSGPNIYTAAWADYDRDGWVDLMMGPMFSFGTFVNGGLFHNVNGVLTRVTSAGIAPAGQIQSVSWADFDNDGDDDLFFAMAPGNEELYRNDGGGAFTKLDEGALLLAGGATVTASWADFDGDGDLDVYLGNVVGQVKFLFRNDGGGSFSEMPGEISAEEGATRASAWGDYDNDGWIDLFVAGDDGSFLFRNQGDGTFSRVAAGSLTGDRAISYGASWVDIDDNGFLDLFVANLSENNFLYRNNGNSNAWLTIKCAPYLSNRSAIGAKVRVQATISGVQRWQRQEIGSRDSFGSPGSLRAQFGLGDATNAGLVLIEWPSGLVTTLSNVAPRQFLTVTEPPTLSILPGSILEGDAGLRDLNLTVRLTQALPVDVSVDFFTRDGTAISGADYIATNGTLQIQAGHTSGIISVPIIGNLVDEPNRSFTIAISNSVNISIAAPIATATIIDDDPVTVRVDNTSVMEAVGGTNMIFLVSLNKPWNLPVTLNFATANSTAIAGQDYVSTNGSLLFQPGEVLKEVPVAILDDTLSEAPETLLFDLSNIVGAGSVRRRAGGVIMDNDPLPVITVSTSAQTEGNAGTSQMQFAVALSAPSGARVTFNATTIDGTASAPADYRSQSLPITVLPGITTTNFSVLINGDTLVEGPESFSVRLSDATDGVLATNLLLATILDDDVRVLPPFATSSNVTLRFNTISNRQHRLEWTESLSAIEWMPVPGAEALEGNGGVIRVVDPQPPIVQRFYRVVLSQ